MMEQKFFGNSAIKTILSFIIIILIGILLIVAGNPFKKVLTPMLLPIETPTINTIEISSDAKSILNTDTKAVIFTIADTQNYLKNSGYFYNPDTFQNTNAKYAGECFLSATLSNKKNRIVFSTGCVSGDLPQAWIGVYNFPPNQETEVYAPFNFLIGGSGKNFVWSNDDKTITYEADLGLSGMTETRTIDSATGEVLDKESSLAVSDLETKYLPDDLKDIIFKMAKRDYQGMDSCDGREVIIDDYQYNFYPSDLNNDGISEFIIEPIGFCNSLNFRGAQGNGPYYIFEKKNDVWKNIGNIGGNGYEKLDRETGGYFDILTFAHMSASSSVLTYYKWQKSELIYKSVSSEEIDTRGDFNKEIKNFIYEANFGLSGMTETRTIDSATGEILERKNMPTINKWRTYKNTEYNFEFKYSQNLLFVPEKVKDDSVMLNSYSTTNIEESLIPDLTIITDKIKISNKIDAQNSIKNLPAYLKGQGPYEDEINGKIVYITRIKLYDGGEGVTSNYYFPEFVLRFSYANNMAENKFKDDVNIEDMIISSIKFIKKDETADWKIYRNDKYGFEFKYPSIFNIKEYSSAIFIDKLIADNACEKLGPPYWCAVRLHVGVEIFPNGIQQYFDTRIPKKEFKEVVFYGIKSFERNGPMLGGAERGNGYIQERKIVFEIDGSQKKVYEISLGYPRDIGDELEVKNDLGVFNQILSTFKFIESEK